MRETDKISLIIPCYWANRELFNMTAGMLNSLMGTNGIPPFPEVIMVDDGSPEKLSDARFKTIHRKINGGYAAAVNTGLKEVRGDYLIVCNNDIEFIDPHWLHHLLEPLKQGADVSTIRSTEPDGWETEDRWETEAYFGNIWAMKREVYEKLGPLDESLGKGYHEDADYRRRAMEAGFEIVKNHNGLVEHKGKATYKVIDPQDKMFKTSRQNLKKKWGEVF